MRTAITLVFLAGVLAAQNAQPDPKGAIRGAVRDTTGLPISGITIEAILGAEPSTWEAPNSFVRIAGKTAKTQTDHSGKYALTDLEPGNYFLRTERDSESTGYKPVKVDAAQEVTLNLVVPAKPSISGQVFDQNGEPLARAHVWLLTADYRAGVLRHLLNGPQITKQDGAYSFQFGVEANRSYHVLVERNVPIELPAALDDRQPIEVPTYYPSAIGMDSATAIVLLPGEQREKVDIKIATAQFYCIDGKVQGSGRLTIQEAPLTGTQLVRLRGRSGQGDKYRLCGLPPGQYRLLAENASTEFTVSSSDLQHVDLSADPAHVRFQIDFAEPPPARLDLTSEATLHQFAALLGLGGSAPIDSDLRRLATWAASGNPAPNDLVAPLARRLGDTPGHAAAKLAAVADQLFPKPPIVNFTLTSLTTGSPAKILASGEIPPDDYLVDFQRFAGTVAYPKEVTFNDVRLAGSVLRIAPGTSGTLRTVLARDAATISVTVADTEGKPIPHATVTLIPEGVTSAPDLSRMAVHGATDQNGSYTSPPLVPGKYKVLATAQTVRWGVPDDLERVLLVLFQAKEVEVAPKATAQIAVEPVPIY